MPRAVTPGRAALRRGLGRDTSVALGLVALGVGLPALLAIISGSLSIAHNDDFAYRRVALGLYNTGRIELTGWSVMSLIGQVVIVQPLLWISRGNTWALAAATCLLAVAGVGAAYSLVRRLLVRPPAMFSVLSLLLFPGFLVNTTSFMTDVPALAGEMVCLALGSVALDRQDAGRWRWLSSSLVVGCFAFSIREFALAAPVAVLVAAAAGAPGRRVSYVLAGCAMLIAFGAIHVVTTNLPGQGTATLELSPDSFVRLRHAAATLGLALSPALVLAMVRWWRHWHPADVAIGGLLGILLYNAEIQAILTTHTMPGVMIGNVLAPLGAPGGVGAGGRPVLFGPPIWDLLSAIGLVAVIASLGVVSATIGRLLRSGNLFDGRQLPPRLGSTQGMLVTFVLLYGAGLLLVALVAPTFDRYLWPLVIPLTCLLLLRPMPDDRLPPSPRAIRSSAYGIAVLLAATLACTSLALLLNASAFEAAGWRMGELAVKRGFAPGTVDAGMAWVGYYATGTADVGAAPSPSETWYDGWWPSFRLCAMVSSSPLDVHGFHLEAADTHAYRLLFFAGNEEPLYLYRVATPGCP